MRSTNYSYFSNVLKYVNINSFKCISVLCCLGTQIKEQFVKQGTMLVIQIVIFNSDKFTIFLKWANNQRCINSVHIQDSKQHGLKMNEYRIWFNLWLWHFAAWLMQSSFSKGLELGESWADFSQMGPC